MEDEETKTQEQFVIESDTDFAQQYSSENENENVSGTEENENVSGTEEIESDEKSETSQSRKIVKKEPYMCSLIMKKDLKVGENISLLVLDVSNLMNFEITVCEYNEQNIAFYDNLDKEIKNYTTENKTEAGYLPLINECILAEYDGIFYRAVCISFSKTKKLTVLFIDYGNIEADVDLANVMKLPASLLYTCCAVSCKIYGLDDEIINSLDQVATKLEYKIIKGQVEKVKYKSGRYQYSVVVS